MYVKQFRFSNIFGFGRRVVFQVTNWGKGWEWEEAGCAVLKNSYNSPVLRKKDRAFASFFCQPCFLCRCTDRVDLTAGQCRQLGTPRQLIKGD